MTVGDGALGRVRPCNSAGPSNLFGVHEPHDEWQGARRLPPQSEAAASHAEPVHARHSGPLATINELGDQLISAMEVGVVRTRSGDRYKPSTIRGYRQTLSTHIYPELGTVPLTELQRSHVQELVDRMFADGVGASTINNVVMPLRVLVRRAIRSEELRTSPLEHLDLPAVRGARGRVATPSEVVKLIAALPASDRAIWAMAFYAGPRRGELMALEIEAIDLDRRRFDIRWSWDMKAGRVAPKSRAGRRTIPISEALALILAKHLGTLGWSSGFVFGRSATRPFEPSVVTERAYRTWRRLGLEQYSLHEARHSYVTFLLAAGVPIKAVSTYAGHASISVTLDRYGHLLPGTDEETARRLDALLAASQSRSGRCT